MPTKTMPARAMPAASARKGADPAIAIRRIGAADLRAALSEGWSDFTAMRGDILFAALLYPLIGIAAAVLFTGGPMLPMLFPILAGVALLGPVAALGFYELARRREAGETGNWSHFLDVRKRPSADEITSVSALLCVVFGLWLMSAGLLYVALWGTWVPPSLAAFFERLFTTGEGWALIILGNALGLAFATLVLALSVVSLPMLVDRDVNAQVAVETSVRAVRDNPGAMARWGATVLALLLLGSIPLFLGLAVILPWLGYATWHLYTRLVERGPRKRTARA